MAQCRAAGVMRGSLATLVVSDYRSCGLDRVVAVEPAEIDTERT